MFWTWQMLEYIYIQNYMYILLYYTHHTTLSSLIPLLTYVWVCCVTCGLLKLNKNIKYIILQFTNQRQIKSIHNNIENIRKEGI